MQDIVFAHQGNFLKEYLTLSSFSFTLLLRRVKAPVAVFAYHLIGQESPFLISAFKHSNGSDEL